MSLAQRGFAVVNFTYRLAPEFQFPASLEDTNTVFRWVLNHAEEYGFDTKHVFAVGDSAGAHILGVYSNLCTNQSYAKEYPFSAPVGFAPTAIGLHCGCYQITFDKSTDGSTKALMAEVLPQKGSEEELKRINVVTHITSNFPPTFLMTCTDDFLIAEAVPLAEKLMKCSVPFRYQFYASKAYPLHHVFHCNLRLKEAAKCNDDVCNFFRTFL